MNNSTTPAHTFSLDGQRALVTGGSRGIGAGIAKALAAAGARVAVNYHGSRESADEVVREIADAGGEAVAVGGDVSVAAEVAELFKEVDRELGGLDILVANAGIQRDAPFLEMTPEQWQAVIDVNLTGQFLCAQAATRRFLTQEREGARGKIVFVSSVHEQIPWAGHVNYAAAKGGLGMLMRSLAQELAGQRVRVNSIAPGAIATDINRDAWETPEALAKLLRLIPYGRVGEPADVGAAVVWMVSDAADYLTGQTIYLDGGMTLYPGFRDNG